MSWALCYLILLQLGGWVRGLVRGFRTFKGAALRLIGLAALVPLLASPLFADRSVSAMRPDVLRTYGPGGLVLYCLFIVLASAGERAVYFTPAEVTFLFPGPFTRRELLIYKILYTLIITIPATWIMLLFLQVFARWLVAAYVGIVLGVTFLQLFSTVMNLIASMVGSEVYGRGRKLILLGVGLGLVGAMLQSGALWETATPTVLWDAFVQSIQSNWVARPLDWFFDAFLATSWMELGQFSLLAALVDMAMLGLVLILDAGYQEVSAAASARIYARLQRSSQGGVLADHTGAARSRLSLPSLPWLGGIGPNLWRQLTTAMRGMVRLVIVFGLLGAVMTTAVLSETAEPRQVPLHAGVLLLLLSVMFTSVVPFDFRGDLDRIPFLKTLPLPAWRLAVGQLLTPALVLSLVQWGVLAAVLYSAPRAAPLLGVMAALALPFNFFLTALENLLFLLFPTRQLGNAAGDMQALGRNVLFQLAKLVAVAVLLILCCVPGVVVYDASNHNLTAALAAAWPVTAVCGAALVPAVAVAFRAFNVGEDMPG